MASLLKGVRAATAGLLIAVFAVPLNLAAQTHVVSEAELQKATAAATQARQQNIETIQQFLSSPQANKALKTAHLDPQRVTQAVSQLDDQELLAGEQSAGGFRSRPPFRPRSDYHSRRHCGTDSDHRCCPIGRSCFALCKEAPCCFACTAWQPRLRLRVYGWMSPLLNRKRTGAALPASRWSCSTGSASKAGKRCRVRTQEGFSALFIPGRHAGFSRRVLRATWRGMDSAPSRLRATGTI